MCQVAPHPLQLLPRGALGSGQISHRPQGPCRSHWSSLAGSSWASCSRPVHTGWCSQVSGDWGDGGAAAGGPGRGGAEREGTRAGGEREGGRPSQPRSREPWRGGQVLARAGGRALSCPAGPLPFRALPEYTRSTLAESRVGGSVCCPLVGAWRCAAVSRTGLQPLPVPSGVQQPFATPGGGQPLLTVG